MLPAACAVGVWLAGMSLRDIVAGFPPLVPIAAAMVANLALIAVATWLFPGSSLAAVSHEGEGGRALVVEGGQFNTEQIVTLICIAALIVSVVTGFWLGLEPDIGVIALGFGAIVALVYPESGKDGMRRIDWSTSFMVGGIITFVAVLQRMDAVNLLGHAAMKIGTPLAAAFVICMSRRSRRRVRC